VRVFSELGALGCVCDTDAARFATLVLKNDPPRFTGKLSEVLDELFKGAHVDAGAPKAKAAILTALQGLVNYFSSI
ncbi:MAG: hypothetical protein WCH61_05740, partial [bacterium]